MSYANNVGTLFCISFFMHGLSEASQHAVSKTFRFIPLQDFMGK